jgi:hypothetical protein
MGKAHIELLDAGSAEMFPGRMTAGQIALANFQGHRVILFQPIFRSGWYCLEEHAQNGLRRAPHPLRFGEIYT